MRQLSFRSRLFTIKKAIVSNQEVKSVCINLRRVESACARSPLPPKLFVQAQRRSVGKKSPDAAKPPIFMSTVIVTGAAGLIGSESVKRFAREGFRVAGIDNDLRRWFFGDGASTLANRRKLIESIPNYQHHDFDIRDRQAVENLFGQLGKDIALIIHTAAQPSHDWAARDPHADFSVNATGTLNLLEATRQFCPEAVFIFTSTNKVYGDTPNRLPLVELEKRWEIKSGHACEPGIPETMSIDQTKHSLFGASKVAADVLVQEYGRYFGMKTACFRGGCLTGPAHAGTELHGFLAYLMRCTVTGTPYRVFGSKGKQVRDNIHSHDLVERSEEHTSELQSLRHLVC